MVRAGEPIRRFILLGAVGSGKTSLLRALEDGDEPVRKTQMIDYAGWGIDTPGEYAEMGVYRERLLAAAADAKQVVVVQDATRARSCFPPHYLLMFPQQVLGAVTKMDLPDANAERATRLLRESGVRGDVFQVSAFLRSGIDALKRRLMSDNLTPEGVI